MRVRCTWAARRTLQEDPGVASTRPIDASLEPMDFGPGRGMRESAAVQGEPHLSASVEEVKRCVIATIDT